MGALEQAHCRWDAAPSWELAPAEAVVGEVGEVGEAEGAGEPATECGPGGSQAPQQRWVLGGSAAASAERAAHLRYVRERSEPALRWALHQAGLLLERRRQTAATPPRALLEIGCGRGDLTLALARAHPALRLVGLDSNACALAAARARAESEEQRARSSGAPLTKEEWDEIRRERQAAREERERRMSAEQQQQQQQQ